MGKKNKTVFKSVLIRITEEQHEKIRKMAVNSTVATVSAFVRNLILGKPVTMFTRDRSYEEVIEIALQIRKSFVGLPGQQMLGETREAELAAQLNKMITLLIQIEENVRKDQTSNRPSQNAPIQ